MMRAAHRGLLLPLILALGCGDGDRTNCAIANESLDKCVTKVVIAPSVASYQRLPLAIGDDCSGINNCAAVCVRGASCDAMRWVLVGHPDDPNSAPQTDAGRFEQCLTTCFETYRKP